MKELSRRVEELELAADSCSCDTPIVVFEGEQQPAGVACPAHNRLRRVVDWPEARNALDD